MLLIAVDYSSILNRGKEDRSIETCCREEPLYMVMVSALPYRSTSFVSLQSLSLHLKHVFLSLYY